MYDDFKLKPCGELLPILLSIRHIRAQWLFLVQYDAPVARDTNPTKSAEHLHPTNTDASVTRHVALEALEREAPHSRTLPDSRYCQECAFSLSGERKSTRTFQIFKKKN